MLLNTCVPQEGKEIISEMKMRAYTHFLLDFSGHTKISFSTVVTGGSTSVTGHRPNKVKSKWAGFL